MKLPPEQIHYVDIPELVETFADSYHLVTFDGVTMRIELCVTRMDTPKPPAKATARQYPVCRLAMTPDLAIDLYNQLQNLIAALERDGLVKRNVPPAVPTPSRH